MAAISVLCLGAALGGDVANGRIPSSGQPSAALMSPDAPAAVTGGGTVVVPAGFGGTAVGSFGLNAKRPPGFTGGGTATGRINYDKHAQSSNGRHTNVPVLFMQAETTSTPPNGTGGKATLSGNCGVPTSECPTGTVSVLVYVEDNSDAGGGVDIFRIFFCTVGAFLPDPTTFDPTMAPNGCQGPEGGLLRSGNIQVRASGPSGSAGNAPTAARVPLRLP